PRLRSQPIRCKGRTPVVRASSCFEYRTGPLISNSRISKEVVRRADPRVSIVLPFRNAAEHIADCLASIRNQTLTEWELIAVDDGSEDASANVVTTHAESDPRIRLLQPGHIGLVA